MRQPTFLNDALVAQLQNGKTYPKHCLQCRTTTDWVFTFLDRRGGADRRKTDRRNRGPNSGYDES